MVLTIDNSRRIEDLQREFSREFPFLRMEFYDRDLVSNDVANCKRAKDGSKYLSDCGVSFTHDTVHVEPTMTVRELEHVFRDKYGLVMEVYRQSGTVWLKTMLTDEWTLSFQNEQGRLLSAPKSIA